jgi:acetyltransferase
VLADGRTWLSELEAKAVLQAYGIPVARSVAVAASEDAAAAAGREIGFPVVLKILSRDITHKSDVGGVALGLRNEAELREAARAMLARVREARPDARLQGLSVQAMIERPRAEELIVGANLDSVFGPVLLFGQGGVAVEVVGDRAIALPPLNEALARELVSRTRVAKLLAGYRDRPAARVDAVIGVLTAVSALLADLAEVTEIDINPLLADDAGVVALDARIRVAADRPGGADRFAIRPYPSHFVEIVRWGDETLTLRPIRPEDEAQHRAFLEKLDPEDIRMRVFYSRRELPRSELARLTQIDYAREMAFIAERTAADGARETIGTVRAVSDPDNTEAEFAVIVRSDLKARGLGRMLLDKIVRYGRAQGLSRLVGVVLRENGAMLELAQHVGFSVDTAKSADADVVHLVMALGNADAGIDSGQSAPPGPA